MKPVIERLYAVARTGPSQRPEIIYGSLATNPPQAWRNVIENDLMGSLQTIPTLRKQGYRAVPAQIAINLPRLPRKYGKKRARQSDTTGLTRNHQNKGKSLDLAC